MKEEIQALLEGFCQKRSDRRLFVCSLILQHCEGDRLILAGEVLDETTRRQLSEEIIKRFPNLIVDDEQVIVLRKPYPEYLWCATNMTSLHREPSWLAEMLSQILYGMRVEILKTENKWVFIRQDDGYLGWAYRPYLSSVDSQVFTHLVTAPTARLFEFPDKKSKCLSRLYSGTAVAVEKIQDNWAFLQPHSESLPCAMPGGWISLNRLENINDIPASITEKRKSILDAAFRFYGVPYLWGGCTTNGIDCSGLAQLCHRFAGLQIPRDADLQMEDGVVVSFPFQPGDLLFFGDEDNLAHISHVGISLGGWEIIHSSRSRNGVYTDHVQQVLHLKETFAGACCFIPSNQ